MNKKKISNERRNTETTNKQMMKKERMNEEMNEG